MKRILSLVLAVMMLALTACGTAPGTTTPTTGTSTPVTGTATGGATATPTPTPDAPLSIGYEKYVMFLGAAYTFSANKEGVKFESSDTETVKVLDDGTVFALKAGSATITATATAPEATATATQTGSEKTEKAAATAAPEVVTCEVTVISALEYFTPADFKTLSVSGAEISEMVVKDMVAIAKQFGTLVEKDGVIEKGDTANIKYVGVLKGETEPFEGGSGTSDLEIGSNTFIPGFEDGLIGYKMGETVAISLTFPEDYRETSMAGKEVVFTVTVNKVMKTELAKVDDEFINEKSNGEFKTVQEYVDYLTAYYTRSEKLAIALEKSEVKGYNKTMVEQYREEFYEVNFGLYAAYYGMTAKELAEKTLGAEAAAEEATKYADEIIKEGYLCYALVEMNNLTLTDEVKNTVLEKAVADKYIESVEAAKKNYNQGQLETFIIMQYVLDTVCEQIEVK